MADAGRVIAGVAAGIRLGRPGPGRDRSPIGSSRRSSRSSSRTCAAPRPRPVRRHPARPASRRCRAARRTPRSSSATGPPPRSSPTNLARTAPGGRARRASSGPRPSAGWPVAEAGAAAALRHRHRRPTVRRARAAGRRARGARRPRLAPGARVVAKHFWRDPPPAAVGLLASERERRFGETALTFYRRAEER